MKTVTALLVAVSLLGCEYGINLDADPVDGPALPGPCSPDNDGDGFCPPDDCDDANPAAYPGAPEPCHPYYVDFDCDGFTSCNDLDCIASGLCPLPDPT